MCRAGVLAIVVLLAGCTPGWPFAGVTVDQSGLGQSRIAAVIARQYPTAGTGLIDPLRRLIDEQIGPDAAPTPTDLEALGATCDGTHCVYRGKSDAVLHPGATGLRRVRSQRRLDVAFDLGRRPVPITVTETRLEVDDSELQPSRISDVVASHWSDEVALGSAIKALVESGRPALFGVTPGYLESLGAHCSVSGATTCEYRGRVRYAVVDLYGMSPIRYSHEVTFFVWIDYRASPAVVGTVRTVTPI